MKHAAIRTFYLLPHAHTDIGYCHDPVVALELHDRFLDRAIALCEQTRGYPDGAKFRWTIEVFSSALRWWDNRGPAEHERLRDCLRRGEIDIGARYLNGTELYAAEDVAWEMGELERLAALTGYRPATAIQNDVNGFPLTFAAPLAAAGVETLIMGLNTTMGHSPFPRCHAFRWQVGDGQELLVWNGWIYNRIKLFSHIDRLAADLPAKLDACFASLPADYPYDFAMTSATMGDNVGPFPSLPEQVRQFNLRSPQRQLRLATFAEFAQALQPWRDKLACHSGNWPDFWTFGGGSMPQMVASLRRAQRRLRLVEAFRAKGFANESGGGLTLDRARRAIAYACEHTYDSHTSSGFACGSPDAMRQKAQIMVDAATAESVSMGLLRDHLSVMAAPQPAAPLAVLVANPHPFPLHLDYWTEEKGFCTHGCSRRPEHLFQFDREPTYEVLAAVGNLGALNVTAPAAKVVVRPLGTLSLRPWQEVAVGEPQTLANAAGCFRFEPQQRGLVSWDSLVGGERLSTDGPFAAFAPVEERPTGAFQVSGVQHMDPSDCAWNPHLRLDQQPLPSRLVRLRRQEVSPRAGLSVDYADSPLTAMEFMLDERYPGRLAVTTSWQLAADPTVRAYYLTLPLALPGDGECDYWVDGCGHWFRAERDQLPGTCNSFYQAQSGIAVSRGGQTLYVAAADTTLFQFGGFTFGQLPAQRLQRQRPFVALWIYNNYWNTNFPGYSPGLFQARFLLEHRSGPFQPAAVAELNAAFDTLYITHPVA